jgi:activating signal cointegrator complex subunit 3
MDANSLTTLPHIDDSTAQQLAARAGITALPQLLHALQRQGGSAKATGSSSSSSSSSSNSRAEVTKLLGSLLGSADAEEVVKVADRMPIVDVSWYKHQLLPDRTAASAAGAEGGEHHHSQQQQQQQEELRWQLEVVLSRRGGGGRSGAGAAAPRVVAPLFPKVKEEGWWLVVGHTQSLELLALKRVSFGGRTSVKLRFPGFTSAGQQVHTASLFLVSDCYMGLDQQYQVVLDEAAAAAAGRAHASLSARAGWGAAGGSSSADGVGDESWSTGTTSSSMQQPQQDNGVADPSGLSRRARRQQQMAARQQHAAGGTDNGADGGWDDEPACS